MKQAEFEVEVKSALDAFDWSYVVYIIGKLTGFRDNDYGFRLAGGEAERKAAEFIRGEFDRLGLVNIRLEEVPVDGWRFKDAYLEIPGSKRRIFKGITYAGFPPGEAEGKLVYVDMGTKNNYRGRDVRGCLVLVELDDEMYSSPLPVFREAYIRGAVGVIVTDHKKLVEGPHEALFTADGEYVDGLPPVIYLAPRDFQYLKDVVNQGNEIQGVLKIDVVLEERKAYNVIGRLGRGGNDNIIVSAHHDAHFNGAVDNASGVAAILLLAKALSDTDLNKDIYFISFTAEEYGKTKTIYDYLMGSYHFFKDNKDIVERNWLFINFDGVGEVDGPVGILYTPELEIFTIDTLSKLTNHVGRGFNLESRPSLWLDQWPAVYNGLSSIAFTNLGHKVFYTRFYHTQLDDISLISEDVFRDYFLTSYIVIRRATALNVPVYEYSRVSIELAKTLDMGVFSYLLGKLDTIEELLSRISMESVKLYKLICEVNSGRHPAGIDKRKLVKGLLISRELLLKLIYWISPWELAPLYPSIPTELYKQLFEILETNDDYKPPSLSWIDKFSKETVEWVLKQISRGDYWAGGKIHDFPIHITEYGIIPDEERLINDFNKTSYKILEDLEIINKILSGLIRDASY